jgi:hypothetical protein
MIPEFVDTRCASCLANPQKPSAPLPRATFEAGRWKTWRCVGCGLQVTRAEMSRTLNQRDWEKNTGKRYHDEVR